MHLVCGESRTRSGKVLGEDQRVSALDALRGITIDAAYQHFEDDIKGSIEPGSSPISSLPKRILRQ